MTCPTGSDPKDCQGKGVLVQAQTAKLIPAVGQSRAEIMHQALRSSPGQRLPSSIPHHRRIELDFYSLVGLAFGYPHVSGSTVGEAKPTPTGSSREGLRKPLIAHRNVIPPPCSTSSPPRIGYLESGDTVIYINETAHVLALILQRLVQYRPKSANHYRSSTTS